MYIYIYWSIYIYICLLGDGVTLGCWLPGMVPAPKLLKNTQGHHRGWVDWAWPGVIRNQLKLHALHVAFDKAPTHMSHTEVFLYIYIYMAACKTHQARVQVKDTFS